MCKTDTQSFGVHSQRLDKQKYLLTNATGYPVKEASVQLDGIVPAHFVATVTTDALRFVDYRYVVDDLNGIARASLFTGATSRTG